MRLFQAALSLVILGLMLILLAGCSDSDSNKNTPEERQSVPERSGISYLEGRYEARGKDNQLIEDTRTGLVWQRCSLGQEWDNTSQNCVGRAIYYRLEEARQQASNHYFHPNDQEPSGLGLPGKEQLLSLVYCPGQPQTPDSPGSGECDGSYDEPTIIQNVFPDTERITYWTQTPMGEGSSTYYGVNFSTGELSRHNSPNSSYPVRLVLDLNN
ncbi:uncharacterized protein DUF1566 [Desulfobotulus alkaliphilus]|uniref:Uncharacterized protein DUF1566 n=1 Tax=Desulfobotulus alkaliphilus TaxID=622671 RepID=A0A562QWJ9_9BACT|nr:DUF1566 domain-containing protein [Desulfobotulus alkaliphilus]TWI60600.1 uncharacterized protein DUF1566 [Desulfobotulus alkaliphilus]